MKTSFYTTEELNELGFDSIGKDCKISRNAQFYGIQNMNLGDNVRIDDFCILSGSISLKCNIHISAYCALYGQYKIEIGSNSGLSPKTVIYTASDDFSGEYMVGPQHADELRNVSSGKVFIGNYCQLGTSSTVMPGISIEDGAVTGVGTFVNKNLAPWGIYIGAPVKFLKQRSKKMLQL